MRPKSFALHLLLACLLAAAAAPSAFAQGDDPDSCTFVLVGEAREAQDGGWRSFDDPAFRNQGECVSFVASDGKARANRRSTGGGRQ